MSVDAKVQRIADGSVWREFCRALERAGQVLLRAEVPGDPLQRAEGVRYLSFGTKSGGYERDGTMAPTGQLDGRDLVVRPDGSFEIAVACEPRPGNWLPMRPDTRSLIVRMTFHDREAEEPARLHLERIGAEGAPALDPESLEETLQRVVGFVERTSNLFVDWMKLYSAHENALPSDDQERCQRAGGDARIHRGPPGGRHALPLGRGEGAPTGRDAPGEARRAGRTWGTFLNANLWTAVHRAATCPGVHKFAFKNVPQVRRSRAGPPSRAARWA